MTPTYRIELTRDAVRALAKLDKPVRRRIQGAIDNANAAVSHAEAIRAFRILPHDFSVESGELTPSMKVRRPKVMEHYADVIAGIYNA